MWYTIEDVDYIAEKILRGPLIAIRASHKEMLGERETLHTSLLSLATERGITLQGEPDVYNSLTNAVKKEMELLTRKYTKIGYMSYRLRTMYNKTIQYYYNTNTQVPQLTYPETNINKALLEDAILQVALDNKLDYAGLMRDFRIINIYGLNEFNNLKIGYLPSPPIEKEIPLMQAFWNADVTQCKTRDQVLAQRYRATASLANKLHIPFDNLNNIVYPSRGETRLKHRNEFLANLTFAVEIGYIEGQALKDAFLHIQKVKEKDKEYEYNQLRREATRYNGIL